jgi:hypothetical protein
MKTTLEKQRDQVKITKKGRVSILLPAYQVGQFRNLLLYFISYEQPGNISLDMGNAHQFLMTTAMLDIINRYFIGISNTVEVRINISKTQAYCLWWLTQMHSHTAYKTYGELSALYMNLHRSLEKLKP